MKYCTSCGAKLNDTAIFCTKCGAKCAAESEIHTIDSDNQAKCSSSAEPTSPKETPSSTTSENVTTAPLPEIKPASKRKLISFVIITIILAFTIVTAVLLFRWYVSTEQQILRALDTGDYDAAVSLMEEYAPSGEGSTLADQLKERLYDIKGRFTEGTTEYAAAKMELAAIDKLGVNEISADLAAVQDYIERLNTSRTSFSTAESFYKTGDYAEAITNYRSVIEDDSNYSLAVEKLADTVNLYRDEVLAKALEYASAELYGDAVAILNEALGIIPDDSTIIEQTRIYEKSHADKLKEDALGVASNYVQNADYLNAIKTLSNILKSQEADADLVSAYNKYCDLYVSQVLEEVSLMLSEKDFEEALSALNTAQRYLPDYTAIQEKLDEVNALKPVLASSLNPVNGGWTWNDGSPKDTFGNSYSDASNYAIFYPYYNISYKNGNYMGYAEYRLYGNYSSFSVDIAPYADLGENSSGYVQIYADDTLVYTSAEVDRKTDCFTCSVDVSGAEYVEIQVILCDFYGALILSNAQFWP